MNSSVWSWALFVLSAFGLWLTGTHLKAGWWYAIANQGAWLTYAWTTGQWGIAANSVVFVALYARNLWRWRGVEMPRLNSRVRSRGVPAAATR